MGASKLFPPAYSFWLDERLAGELNETLATCDTCAMVVPEGPTRDPGPFLAHLKCCTYFPFVPNFSVGSLLLTKEPEILLRLKTAESQGLLLPLGLYATPERQSLMEDRGSGSGVGRPAENGFGQRAELLCPFFETSTLGCSIWSQRPGVCTTYFCKSNRGTEGLVFWADVEKYLNYFEWTLAREVFSRVGLGENEIEMCKAVMTTEAGDVEREYFLRAAWGIWFSKKEEFFIACAKEAGKISSREVGDLLDKEYLALEQSLRARI